VLVTQAQVTRRMRAPEGYNLAGTLSALMFSRYDPCARFVDGEFWWAVRTPDGPATLSLHRDDADLVAAGYGTGAAWVVDHADAVAGLRDDLTGFTELAATHPVVAELARRHRGLRLPTTGRVFGQLLRAICEQKVTGKEAYRSYAAIVRRSGQLAPGPVPQLLLPPDPAEVAATPYWAFHPLGLEQRRADTLRLAAAEAARLERCASPADATARMIALAGVGPWTAAEVVRVAYGDPDAVSVGDFHIPNTVAWALAGEPRGDDARMLELLAPFTGHRGRVCLLLKVAGIGAPRFGPRLPIRSFNTY
jgi:3-methyladenine DNA glycosylase/8-oxoguanine DNA glycosylase